MDSAANLIVLLGQVLLVVVPFCMLASKRFNFDQINGVASFGAVLLFVGFGLGFAAKPTLTAAALVGTTSEVYALAVGR